MKADVPLRLTRNREPLPVRRVFPPEKADKVLPIADRWTKIMKLVNG